MADTIVSRIRLLSSVVLLIPPSTAWGQGEVGSPETSNEAPNDIIVTAQKREQSVETVGMSIRAVTGDQLRQLGVEGVSDLIKIEPSFVVTQSVQGQPVYSIRGVGFNIDTTGAPSAVSVYVDEVPHPFVPMSKGATLDLGRVEILKGPQGTLFGQNATGGAINYIAAKPTDSFKFGVDASWVRFNATKVEGFVSGPISSTLKARLAASIDQGGAWQRSDTRGEELGDKNIKKVRLLLDWQPTERLKLSVNLNGWTDNSETQAAAMGGVALQFPGNAALVPLIVNQPIAPHNSRIADWTPGTRPHNDQDFYQGSLRLDYDVSDALQLTYLGTYQHYKQQDLLSFTGTQTVSDGVLGATVKSTSHELRLNGKVLDNKLMWLIGGYYAKDKDDEFNFNRTSGLSTAYSLVGLPGVTQPLQAVKAVMTQDIETKAIFGNLEFHVLDTLSIHAGARYTDTQNAHTGCTQAPDAIGASTFTILQTILKGGVGVVPVQVGGCESFGNTNQPLADPFTPQLVRDSLNQDNVSWRFGIDWTPVEKTLLYATVSRGYKAGSFPNDGVATNLSLEPAVQESVTAYEAGFKSRLAANALQLDGAVFFYDYKNKQQALFKPDPLGVFGFLSQVLNVPKSELTGAELNMRYMPTTGLTINGAFTYLDSKVSGDFFNYNQFQSTPINFKGEPLPNTPKWAFSMGARYKWPVGSYSAYVGGDVRYSSRTQSYFGTANAIAAGFPSLFNEDYAILNLRAGLDSDDGHWRFQIFGENVTDTYYTTQNIRLDTIARYVGMPVTYGIRVGYRY